MVIAEKEEIGKGHNLNNRVKMTFFTHACDFFNIKSKTIKV